MWPVVNEHEGGLEVAALQTCTVQMSQRNAAEMQVKPAVSGRIQTIR